MDLARSTYYYREQPSEAKQTEELAMVKQLAVLALKHTQYGVRRMTAELKAQGFEVNRKRVYRLMQEHRLLWKVKKAFVVTTNRRHGYERYPNLYENIIPGKLHQVWVAEITYVRLRKGHAYLAVILDACSRRVIGWELSKVPDASLTLRALECALVLRNPAPGCIHHSDQGVQYACHAYTDLLQQRGFRISMSHKANPWDNAQAESFMATLKKEEVYLSNYETFEEAQARLPCRKEGSTSICPNTGIIRPSQGKCHEL
jgi:putative transposase